ncbi:hypothetical protein BH23ACT6_BH23ACT6_27770 [soil metagenome]
MSSAPHIVVWVAPRLLGDVLCLALRAEGLQVELYLDDGPEAAVVRSKPFDLALVTEPLPGDVVADTVLVLDQTGSHLALEREGHHRPLGVDDQLTELIGLVEGVLAGGVPG